MTDSIATGGGVDPTVDPALRSWVDSAAGSDFPLQSLPYGVFSVAEDPPRVGVAIGDWILDLADAGGRGLLESACPDAGRVFAGPALNPFMALGRPAWRAVRHRISELLSVPVGYSGEPPGGDSDATAAQREAGACLVDRSAATLHLPFEVADYVDFYSSIHHATNMGRIFRPEAPPLLPNWRRLPVAYHGRSGTVVVTGTPVRRPSGQRRGPDGDLDVGSTDKLDVELEVGFVVGTGTPLGAAVAPDAAADHVFGCVLVNDWSARDIQAWETQPLGPFLGKSFATSISAWVVPLDALQPARTPGPPQDPPPFDHLRTAEPWGFDLDLEVWLRPAGSSREVRLSRVNFGGLYWTMAQQLAHLTSNGASLRTGDLFASGTVSGPSPEERGSLLELSWNGSEPIDVGGVERTFLEDGDEVVLRGSTTAGGVRLGLGDVAGRVVSTVPGRVPPT